ncbi:YybH family protein [Kordiimonas sp.]|uniref:YybH family protein n=1 Tax=Kordiimonas sp. TaxID=1970157 RepID=UPI003A93FD0B
MRFATIVVMYLMGQAPLWADTVDDINTEVWEVFTRSYQENDGELHVSIYHPEVVRPISQNGTVLSGTAYTDHLRKMFANRKARGASGADIHFRFNERLHNNDSAYEVGIYRLTGQRPDGTDFVNYGNFRVVLKKHEGRWKIMFDADVPADEAAWDAAPIKISR